jgi:hypothetical protein
LQRTIRLFPSIATPYSLGCRRCDFFVLHVCENSFRPAIQGPNQMQGYFAYELTFGG